MKLITHHHRKVLYGSVAYLNESLLKRAIRQSAKIEVVCSLGTFIIEPKEWLETGILMEKVFRRPNEPMRLRGKSLIKVEKPDRVATLF